MYDHKYVMWPPAFPKYQDALFRGDEEKMQGLKKKKRRSEADSTHVVKKAKSSLPVPKKAELSLRLQGQELTKQQFKNLYPSILKKLEKLARGKKILPRQMGESRAFFHQAFRIVRKLEKDVQKDEDDLDVFHKFVYKLCLVMIKKDYSVGSSPSSLPVSVIESFYMIKHICLTGAWAPVFDELMELYPIHLEDLTQIIKFLEKKKKLDTVHFFQLAVHLMTESTSFDEESADKIVKKIEFFQDLYRDKPAYLFFLNKVLTSLQRVTPGIEYFSIELMHGFYRDCLLRTEKADPPHVSRIIALIDELLFTKIPVQDNVELWFQFFGFADNFCRAMIEHPEKSVREHMLENIKYLPPIYENLYHDVICYFFPEEYSEQEINFFSYYCDPDMARFLIAVKESYVASGVITPSSLAYQRNQFDFYISLRKDKLYLASDSLLMSKRMVSNSPYLKYRDPLVEEQIVIIGGGSAGIETALELARQGQQLILIERNDELLTETARCNPGRIGLGFHYPDKETALHCLENAMIFTLKYREFFRKPSGVVYLVAKESQVPLEKIKSHFKMIQAAYADILRRPQKYAELVDFSEETVVRILLESYGKPEDFLTELSESEYRFVKPGVAQCAIKVPEYTINWPAFRAHLIEQVKTNAFITLKTGTVVSNIEYADSDHIGRYLIKTKTSSKKSEILYADIVINAAWEKAESLTQNLVTHTQKWTKRLKLMTAGKAEHLKHLPSMVFIYGPHCAMTNLGDGTLYMTYEPATNLGSYDAIERPADHDQYFQLFAGERKAKLFESIKKPIGEYYVPGVEDVEDLEYRVGYVKVPGAASSNRIDEKDSSIHKRTHHGVVVDLVGVIQANAMKLVHSVDTATVTHQAIAQFALQKKEIILHINNIEAALEQDDKIGADWKLEDGGIRRKIFLHFYISYLSQWVYESSDPLKPYDVMMVLFSDKFRALEVHSIVVKRDASQMIKEGMFKLKKTPKEALEAKEKERMIFTQAEYKLDRERDRASYLRPCLNKLN